MKRILLYMHGGSGNKGCEAIVRSTIGILNRVHKNDITLATWESEEDKKCGIDKICNIYQAANLSKAKTVKRYLITLYGRIFKTPWLKYKLEFYPFSKLKNQKFDLAMSIGGDNFCYQSGAALDAKHTNDIEGSASKTVLWGCSVEPEYLNAKTIEHLKNYDMIFARESITYNALLNTGGGIRVSLYPDPAFTLLKEECTLPDGFDENNTLGINLSPYAYSGDKKLADGNYINLIKWVLDNTDMKIALIPHVNKGSNRDDYYLDLIKKEFPTDRVIKIRDMDNCMQTKYIISKCRFFIGARTHSTIAAYSSKVPVIVLGYSVKARGIAEDIFGKEENYLLSVHDFKSENDLLDKFKLMLKNENKIRQHYNNFMDEYIDRAYKAGEEVMNL